MCRTQKSIVISVLSSLQILPYVFAWSSSPSTLTLRSTYRLDSSKLYGTADESESISPKWLCRESNENTILPDRRTILISAAAASFSAGLSLSNPASAEEALLPSNALAVPNLQCLTDLPPITPGCVRLYLCRHGQTENNRLRKVQGARIDPTLNIYGREMAKRIGMALSYLPDDLVPRVAVHSTLARAKETAQIASKTLSDIREYRKKKGVGVQPDPATLMELYEGKDIAVPTANELSNTAIQFDTLASLSEVDFGTGYEGASVEAVKAGMYATYGSWAVGMIDRRMDGGGESGREVLARGAEALQSLAQIAQANGGTLLAVSHSTYLRTLLGAVGDVPLAQAATMEIKNGCINVLDVNVEGSISELGPKSGMFGGSLSIVKDFALVLPQTSILRQNECRHLEGITWPTAG